MTIAWIFPVLLLQRLYELFLSNRNRKAVEARGGLELHAETFPAIAVLHGAFLAALVVESYPWRVPPDVRTIGCLAVLALLSAIRYWCIASLGPFWNVRIVVLPGHPRVRRGPYRFLKHPNYVVVALEFLVLPLLLRAPWTLALFLPVNVLLLRKRIRLEEKALRDATDAGEPATTTGRGERTGSQDFG